MYKQRRRNSEWRSHGQADVGIHVRAGQPQARTHRAQPQRQNGHLHPHCKHEGLHRLLQPHGQMEATRPRPQRAGDRRGRRLLPRHQNYHRLQQHDLRNRRQHLLSSPIPALLIGQRAHRTSRAGRQNLHRRISRSRGGRAQHRIHQTHGQRRPRPLPRQQLRGPGTRGLQHRAPHRQPSPRRIRGRNHAPQQQRRPHDAHPRQSGRTRQRPARRTRRTLKARRTATLGKQGYRLYSV